MPFRSIEVRYDVSSIPPGFPHPVHFRNAALDLIGSALAGAGAGAWAGTEIGPGRITVGFDVDDAETAEGIVRSAVAGTPFACIRDIRHLDSEPA